MRPLSYFKIRVTPPSSGAFRDSNRLESGLPVNNVFPNADFPDPGAPNEIILFTLLSYWFIFDCKV
jgi:hypothetical protein